ncbi:MAG: hypothetical protein EZS28_010423, partial [Streblomastix strix]
MSKSLSNLPDEILRDIFGICTPRVLYSLLLTCKRFKPLIFSDEVLAKQIQKITDKRMLELSRPREGGAFDGFDLYQGSVASSDCVTNKRLGDVMDGFIAGKIEETRASSKLDEFRYELEGRGRRCPNCKLKNVRADLGVKVTLACGKVKYFHHPCLDPYVATHISERLSVDIIEKSFVLLAGRRGYPSISPISKYESTSTNIEQDNKESNEQQESDDWELEVEKEIQKEEEQKKLNEEQTIKDKQM